jgi:hypothetical protein
MQKENFETQFKNMLNTYTQIWWSTNKSFPNLAVKTSYWIKRKNEKTIEIFIKDFLKYIRDFPKNESDKVKWKTQVQKLLNKFIQESSIITESDKNILFNEDLINSTKLFIKEAKEFNEKLTAEDIGQALRNLWILNIIQLLLSKKSECTPSTFGYSMLYPYTDNYLDDVNISREDKKKFNTRLAKRLKGESLDSINDHENDIFTLISKIESQYKREEYPDIFYSLSMIQRAQQESILQQGKKTSPYETDILGISFKKGGASVLADAYIANGTLSNEYADFFFGYGILLQLCDDLQDAKEDLKNCTMTVFSQLTSKYPLDNITNSLINFTCDLLDNANYFKASNINELKELIRKNCILLIYFAIAKNKSFYSSPYYKEIKAYLPYTPSYMNNLHKKLKGKFSKLDESYNDTKVEDILLYALESK